MDLTSMAKRCGISSITPSMGTILMLGELINQSKQWESLQLEKLEKIPAEQIEARAKAEGVWQAGTSPHKPANYDLVTFDTFSPNESQSQTHVGLVAGTKKDGTLQVVTKFSSHIESVPRDEMSGLPGISTPGISTFPSLEEDIHPSQIRGVISKPIPKNKNGNRQNQRDQDKLMNTIEQSLTVHRNLINLMTGLLRGE